MYKVDHVQAASLKDILSQMSQWKSINLYKNRHFTLNPELKERLDFLSGSVDERDPAVVEGLIVKILQDYFENGICPSIAIINQSMNLLATTHFRHVIALYNFAEKREILNRYTYPLVIKAIACSEKPGVGYAVKILGEARSKNIASGSAYAGVINVIINSSKIDVELARRVFNDAKRDNALNAKVYGSMIKLFSRCKPVDVKSAMDILQEAEAERKADVITYCSMLDVMARAENSDRAIVDDLLKRVPTIFKVSYAAGRLRFDLHDLSYGAVYFKLKELLSNKIKEAHYQSMSFIYGRGLHSRHLIEGMHPLKHAVLKVVSELSSQGVLGRENKDNPGVFDLYIHPTSLLMALSTDEQCLPGLSSLDDITKFLLGADIVVDELLYKNALIKIVAHPFTKVTSIQHLLMEAKSLKSLQGLNLLLSVIGEQKQPNIDFAKALFTQAVRLKLLDTNIYNNMIKCFKSSVIDKTNLYYVVTTLMLAERAKLENDETYANILEVLSKSTEKLNDRIALLNRTGLFSSPVGSHVVMRMLSQTDSLDPEWAMALWNSIPEGEVKHSFFNHSFYYMYAIHAIANAKDPDLKQAIALFEQAKEEKVLSALTCAYVIKCFANTKSPDTTMALRFFDESRGLRLASADSYRYILDASAKSKKPDPQLAVILWIEAEDFDNVSKDVDLYNSALNVFVQSDGLYPIKYALQMFEEAKAANQINQITYLNILKIVSRHNDKIMTHKEIPYKVIQLIRMGMHEGYIEADIYDYLLQYLCQHEKVNEKTALALFEEASKKDLATIKTYDYALKILAKNLDCNFRDIIMLFRRSKGRGPRTTDMYIHMLDALAKDTYYNNMQEVNAYLARVGATVSLGDGKTFDIREASYGVVYFKLKTILSDKIKTSASFLEKINVIYNTGSYVGDLIDGLPPLKHAVIRAMSELSVDGRLSVEDDQIRGEITLTIASAKQVKSASWSPSQLKENAYAVRQMPLKHATTCVEGGQATAKGGIAPTITPVKLVSLSQLQPKEKAHEARQMLLRLESKLPPDRVMIWPNKLLTCSATEADRTKAPSLSGSVKKSKATYDVLRVADVVEFVPSTHIEDPNVTEALNLLNDAKKDVLVNVNDVVRVLEASAYSDRPNSDLAELLLLQADVYLNLPKDVRLFNGVLNVIAHCKSPDIALALRIFKEAKNNGAVNVDSFVYLLEAIAKSDKPDSDLAELLLLDADVYFDFRIDRRLYNGVLNVIVKSQCPDIDLATRVFNKAQEAIGFDVEMSRAYNLIIQRRSSVVTYFTGIKKSDVTLSSQRSPHFFSTSPATATDTRAPNRPQYT